MGVHRRRLVASVVGALAAAGCAGPGVLHGHSASAFAGSVNVIRGWSTALRTGHLHAAAEYFQIPSVFVNGPQDVFVLRSLAAAEVVNRLLPCGAQYVSATRQGHFVDALFKLTDRTGPGGGPGRCGAGPGATARVDFIIRDGKITHWLRAPSLPGDNGSPRSTPSPGTATSPGTNTAPPGSGTTPTPTSPRTATGPEPAV